MAMTFNVQMYKLAVLVILDVSPLVLKQSPEPHEALWHSPTQRKGTCEKYYLPPPSLKIKNTFVFWYIKIYWQPIASFISYKFSIFSPISYISL